MPEAHEQEVRLLREHFWSDRDPEGRAFAPLAEAYRLEGDLDEALNLVRDGLGRLPDFPAGHLIAARIARDRDDHLAARDHLDRVLAVDPENALALVDRAELSVVEGDIQRALVDLGAVLKLDPSDEAVRAKIRECEEIRSAEPHHEGHSPPVLAEPRAHAAAESGAEETDGAPRPLLRPFLMTRTMGDLYARQGLIARAIEVYERLLDNCPQDSELAARIAELRGRIGSPEGATLQSAAPHSNPAGPESEAVRAEEVGVDEASPGSTIRRYFEDLLAWVPGAVPVESLAPDPRPSTGTFETPPQGLAFPVGEGPDRGADSRPEARGEDVESPDGASDFEDWLRSLRS